MKHSVVIIDDEILAVELLADYCSKLDHLEVKASFTDPVKAYNYLSRHPIDLVFLDINMPELGGLDLAKVLSPDTRLIFATAYREFGVEAFELKALDYLLKPIGYARFLQSVQRFMESKPQSTPSEEGHLIIRVDRKDHKVRFGQILFVEGLKDYVKIHLTEGILLTKASVGLFLKKLPADQFLRIHKSYIVNRSKVTAVGNEEVLVGKKSLPVGITFREQVQGLFGK